MVMPVCQTGITDMFEPVKWNVTAFSESCWETYGVKPELYKPVIIYGGKNIKASSNIIFTYVSFFLDIIQHFSYFYMQFM